MKRDIEKTLIAWKEQKNRFPLLMRGARQVGKTYVVERFGKEAFAKLVSVNFEYQPQLKKCFETLNPKEILDKLTLLLGEDISPSDTLLFLDEIQECPSAIMALRYFKEKLPEMAVIGAGSLLDFALKSEDFRMPVGRVQFLHLGPVSFGEFLTGSGHGKLREYLQTIRIGDNSDDIIHHQLLGLVRQYWVLGGMPAVLAEYFSNQDRKSCQTIQASILQTYRSDFGKYVRRFNREHLERVFTAVPRLVGQRFKYVHVDSQIKSRELKRAMELLVLAGLIQPIYATSASGLPLGAQLKETKMKIGFLDVGLLQNACGLQAEVGLAQDLMQINAGAVAEQFVGQELVAYGDPYRENDLFFWTREKPSSSAEVDFVIAQGSGIYPIEVKSGKTGSLKSLKLFVREKTSSFGIRISQQQLSLQDQVLSIPLYMLEQLPRLIAEAMDK